MTRFQALELLERYFAGETDLAEETLLKAYFRHGDIDPGLEKYAPLFRYWEQESRTVAPRKRRGKSRWTYTTLAAIAAALLLLVAVEVVHRSQQPTVSSFPVAQRQPVDWSRYEITDEREALRFLHGVLDKTSEQLTKAPTITIRELREVERIID